MSDMPFPSHGPASPPLARAAMQGLREPATLAALVFDVDGTLADTEETHREAFNDAFMRFRIGWEWSRAEYRKLLRISGGKERMVEWFATLPVTDAERARLIQLAPAVHRAKTALYTELVADGRCPLRPGIARLMDEALHAGVSLAIASTTTEANVDALLSRHLGAGALRRFATIACGDLVAAKKPAPDIYRHVLSTLGLPATRCIAVEDSRNGVRAAKAAGLYTVVTPTPWTLGDDFADADLELSHLGDAAHPLPPAQAERVGAPWLGLDTLARLHAQTIGTGAGRVVP
jgi:HAD superfamily hydrolase (TIGR01509 family)